jgi:hypothetical protein
MSRKTVFQYLFDEHNLIESAITHDFAIDLMIGNPFEQKYETVYGPEIRFKHSKLKSFA